MPTSSELCIHVFGRSTSDWSARSPPGRDLARAISLPPGAKSLPPPGAKTPSLLPRSFPPIRAKTSSFLAREDGSLPPGARSWLRGSRTSRDLPSSSKVNFMDPNLSQLISCTMAV